MKRIFLFFLLVLGVFTLVACDNTKYTITYELDGGTLTNEVTSFTKKIYRLLFQPLQETVMYF